MTELRWFAPESAGEGIQGAKQRAKTGKCSWCRRTWKSSWNKAEFYDSNKTFFTHASSQTHTHHSTPPLRIHKDKSSQTRSCAEAMVLAAIMWIGADSMGACVSQHQGCVWVCVCMWWMSPIRAQRRSHERQTLCERFIIHLFCFSAIINPDRSSVEEKTLIQLFHGDQCWRWTTDQLRIQFRVHKWGNVSQHQCLKN